MQHPVVRADFLVDVGVVDRRANDEEIPGDIDAVTEALEDFSLGGVLDGEGRGDGAGEQPALVHGVLPVHKHNAVVLLVSVGSHDHLFIVDGDVVAEVVVVPHW